MLNSISVYNYHFREFPRVVMIEHQDREVYVEILSQKHSMFRVSPCLYCLSIDGMILFQDREFNVKGSEIDLADFLKALKEYIPCYINSELKKAASKLDLIRLYVRINEISRAESLIPAIEVNGDLKMIDFMIKYKFMNFKTSNQRSLNNEIGDFGNSKHKQYEEEQAKIDYAEPMPEDSEKYQKFADVCSKVDENTKFIFVNEVVDLFPSDYFLAIDSFLNYEKVEFSIFTRVKMADLLIRRKKNRMATFFLLLAAKSISKEADLLFKKNLIRLALKLVEEASWCNVFKDIAREYEIDEIFYYGSPVCNESSLDSFMFLQGLNGNFRFKVEPDELIYEFNVVKTIIKDKFISKIKIKNETCYNKTRSKLDNKDCQNGGEETKIIGVLDSKNIFYQAFYVNRDAVISVETDIEIANIVLGDGSEIQCGRCMKKIDNRHDIELVDVIKGDNAVLKFAYRDCLECRVYVLQEHNIIKNNTGFILNFDKSMESIEIAVEIAENSFVNRKYQF